MKHTLSSLDRAFTCEADVIRPDRYRQLLSLEQNSTLAPQGGAVSYLAASFGGGSQVVNMSRFDRLLEFDSKNQTLYAEAGITLDKIFRFLSPRGFMMPVMPGHPHITLGGCIAANVHGKNHFRDGIFSKYVEEVRLFHPTHGELILNRKVEPELFELTCGGYGLTGIILSAKIKVTPLEGNCFEITRTPINDLEKTFCLLDQQKNDFDIIYSWNDLARFDNAMGRGYIVAGKLTTREYLSPPPTDVPRIDPYHQRRFLFPLINKMTLPILNAVYYRATKNKSSHILNLFSAFFPAWNKLLYFNSYGCKGFIEPQVLVPEENKFDYLTEFESLIRRHRQPFGVASFKIFRGRQKLLHYNGTGISFSLHIPNNALSQKMLSELDRINLRHGTITNIIKDSRFSADMARAQYPEFEEFASRLKAFDPRRLCKTALSERLGI